MKKNPVDREKPVRSSQESATHQEPRACDPKPCPRRTPQDRAGSARNVAKPLASRQRGRRRSGVQQRRQRQHCTKRGKALSVPPARPKTQRRPAKAPAPALHEKWQSL